MNSKERVKMALNGEMPDKTPVILHNFLMAIRENGYKVKDFRNSPKVIADVFEATAYKYDVDGVLLEMDTALLADCVGVPVDFPEDEPARTHKGLLNSLDDIYKLKEIDFSKTRASIVLEAAEILVSRLGKDFYIRGNCDQASFSLAGLIRGTEDFLVDVLTEEPEKVKCLLDYATKVTCDFMTLMAKTGVDMLSNGDSPAGPDMVSPNVYREFAMPYEKKIVDHSHKLGLPYILHICGNTTLILDDMVATGSDCLELDYKTDIHKILDATKGKTAFSGNVDPANVIGLGSIELIKEKTLELMEIQKDNPRFILNAGCSIPPETPPENIRAFIETGRNFVRGMI